MWIIHIHDSYTSAIDKYFLFTNKKDAIKKFKNLIEESKQFIDREFVEEELETSIDEYCKVKGEMTFQMKGDNYMVLAKFDKNGDARRP